MMSGMEKMTWRTWVVGLTVITALALIQVALGPGWFAVAYGGP